MSDIHDELSTAAFDWGRPNERTAFVDAALVRVSRALDAVASAHPVGGRKRKRTLAIDSALGSTLVFELTADGRWHFVEGTWQADGLPHASRLLRPTLRGIARAAKPRHAKVLRTVTQDVDLACADLLAAAGSAVPAGGAAPTADKALARAFGFGREDRRALRAAGSVADIGAGTALMLRGEAGGDVVFLLDGVVAVETDGAEVRLGPGSVLGETAVLTGKPRSATVRTLSEVLVLVVPGASVVDLPLEVRGALGRKLPA